MLLIQHYSKNSTSQIGLLFYLLVLIYFGIIICKFCLLQQDICYLLAMGRWIVEHKALPSTDPFSWTYAIFPNGCPFVVHQWLTDIIFFLLATTLRANSLVLITAIAFCISFLILPSQILRRFNLNNNQTLGLLSLCMINAQSHLQTRPEIFSYIFIAFYYFILIKADQRGQLTKSSMAALFISMAFWCNLHSGFAAGFMIVCFWGLFSFIDQLLLRKNKFDYNYLVTVPLCFIATLINPVGYKLWLYLPSLYFSPIRHYISEWRHIDLSFLHYEALYPLLVVISIFIVVAYKKLQAEKLKEIGLKPFFLGLISIVICLYISRFMSIAALSLIIAIAMLLNKSTVAVNRNFNLSSFGFPSTFIVLATTIFITDKFIPAQLAASYDEFTRPMGAITFLKEHPQKGKLLNDFQYGDVLAWYLQPCPKIFIDSRFDLYSADMVDKYFRMIECKPGWQNYLNSLNIDWILFSPKYPLANALYKDPAWKVQYCDYTVLIMRKKEPALNTGDLSDVRQR